MIFPKIHGWTRTSTSRGAPLVEFCEGGEEWLDVASKFMNGSLSQLTTVGSAETSEVFHLSLDNPQGNYYIKRYRDRDALDPWKNTVRASRGRRAVRNDLLCHELGFSVAQPRCLIEKRRGVRLMDCVVISDAIEKAPILRDWLTLPELELSSSRAEKQRMLHTLAVEVARWHEAGLHHGDLRAGNILIRKEEGSYKFFWLDNERTQKFSKLPIRNRIHNLSRLNLEPCGVDNTDRLRFWKTYCEHCSMTPAEQGRVQAEVLAITLRRRKKRGWA